MTPYTSTHLLCLLVFVQWSFLVEGSHFRHAVMSFVPADADNNTVRFTFRLALRRSYYSYYCDENTINVGGIIGSGGSWTAKCSDPFSAVCSLSYNIADTRFRCTDFSRNEDWSMGENNFTYTFPSGNLEWNVRYQSCCWISNLVRYADSQWSVSTKISLSRRSDSGKVNSSPVSKSPAIVRFQQGCQKSLKIPVEDPDGDFVKCRWATSAESSIPSDSFPYGELDEKNCILTYRGGLGASGTYVVTLTLEDFPAGTTNFNNIRPFSAVPLQFLVIIGVGSGSCQDIPVFTASTPQNGECSEIQIGSVYKAVIEVQLPNVSKHIVEITTSSPLGMQLTPLSSHGGIFFRNVTWYPSQNQIGQQLFCFQALDSDGLQSEWRCVTILVGLSNTPHVILGTRRPISPISEIGTGLIWWSIHFNRVIKKPRSSAFIRLVLQSNGFTVFKVNALSGYVIVDSNRTVLHFATPKAALSMNGSYAILIDPGAVVGQGCSNDGPPTPGITSPRDWAFPVDGVCPLGYALVSPSFQKCEDIDECGGHHRSKRSPWWYNVFSQNSGSQSTSSASNISPSQVLKTTQ
nr:integrin beta-like protein C [Pocillopora verrucosa]